MPELAVQLRTYFDAIDPPFAVEELIAPARPLAPPEPPVVEGPREHLPLPPTRPPWRPTRRRWVAALVAVALVLIAVGGFAVLQRVFQDPVVDEPTPSTTLPPAPTTQPAPPTTEPQTLAPGFVVSSVDTEGVVGNNPAIAMAPGGNPVVAYRGAGERDIRVAVCSDPACGSAESVVSVAEVGGDAFIEGPELALLPDGRPVIGFAFRVEVDGDILGDLEVVVCADPGCSTWTRRVIVEDDAVLSPLVAVTDDGLPLIGYFAKDNSFYLARCEDDACGSWSTTTVETAAEWTGSLAGAASRPPTFLYQMDDRYRIATCADVTCSQVPVTVLDEIDYWQPVMTQGPTGPVIATVANIAVGEEGEEGEGGESSVGDLVVITCADAACGQRSMSPPLFSAREIELEGVAIGPDGNPVVAFGSSDGGLTVARCGDPACTSGATISRVAAGSDAALAIGEDGIPLLAQSTGSDLVMIRCADQACAEVPEPPAPPGKLFLAGPGWTVRVASGEAIDWPPPIVAFDASGLPVIVHGAEGGLIMTRCAEADCSEATSSDPLPIDSGFDASMAVDGDGRPVAAFWSYATGRMLGFSRCSDAACADAVTTELFDASAWASPDIEAAGSGLMVMAFQNYTFNPGPIQVAFCADADCSSVDVVDADFDCVDADCERFWIHNTTRLALTADDRPVVVYSSASGRTRLVVCTEPDCGSFQATTLDDTGGESEGSEVVIGVDGNPVVAYYADGHARLAFCRDVQCVSVEVAELGPATRWTLFPPRMAVLGDGRVVVGFGTEDGGRHLAVCAYPCDQPNVVTLADVTGPYAVTAGPDGLPLIAFVPAGGEGALDLVVAKCVDPACLPG